MASATFVSRHGPVSLDLISSTCVLRKHRMKSAWFTPTRLMRCFRWDICRNQRRSGPGGVLQRIAISTAAELPTWWISLRRSPSRNAAALILSLGVVRLSRIKRE